MFQRLLVCTTLKDGLQRLVNFVPSLAASGIREITFLHAIPYPAGQTIPRLDEAQIKQSRNRLSAALVQAPEDVKVKIEVQAGKPLDCILNAVKAYKPDLIILGTSERSSLGARLFGSTITELSKRHLAPLLIVRPQLFSTYRVEELDLRCRHLFQSLLIPYDGSKAADYLVEQLQQIARDRTPQALEQCLLCWVLEEGKYINLMEGDDHAETQRKLETVQTSLESLDLKVSVLLAHGEPVPGILQVAAESDISAIACSSGSFGKLIEWSIPSFAGEILSRSWHPVLFFPPGL